MNEAETIATWDVLKDFGFEPDSSIFSDITPGLTCDFGNFKLQASCCINMSFAQIVLLTGIMVSSRKSAEVHIEMPRRIISRKQCAAWIVWHLDQSVGGAAFTPTRTFGWIEEGRNNLNLLPWIAQL